MVNLTTFLVSKLFIFIGLCFNLRQCIEIDLTAYVEPGINECFYQFISKDTKYEVEFQVIEGGDLDLNLQIVSPSGRVLVTKYRATEAMHRATTEEEGDYKFCLDNSFSRFSRKMVFFDLLTDDEEMIDEVPDLPVDESFYDIKIEDLKAGFAAIKQDLDKSREILRVLKAIETRDRSIAEHNFERVNFWSSVQLFIMISVGLVQVLMIRGLFDDGHGGNKGVSMKMKT